MSFSWGMKRRSCTAASEIEWPLYLSLSIELPQRRNLDWTDMPNASKHRQCVVADPRRDPGVW